MSIPPGQPDQPSEYPPAGSPQTGYPAPGGPTPYQPSPPQGTSGLAIAGLILAFLFAPIGFLLSLIAFFTTGKGRKQGKGLAVAGLVVSLVVMGIGAALAFTVLKNVTTVADPGCTQGKDVILSYADVGSDTDPDAMTTKLQTLITGLDKAAASAEHDEVRTAMKALGDDYRQLLKSIPTGQVPPTLTDKVAEDANKIDELCTIGGAQN